MCFIGAIACKNSSFNPPSTNSNKSKRENSAGGRPKTLLSNLEEDMLHKKLVLKPAAAMTRKLGDRLDINKDNDYVYPSFPALFIT